MTDTNTKMTAKDVLIRARALIADKGWTQGAYVRDADGKKVSMSEATQEGVCFCTVGALHTAGLNVFDRYVEAKKIFQESNSIPNIVNWNDITSRTKEQVLEAFDKAIAAAS